MSVPDRFLDPPSPSELSARRQERWIERAEADGCEACGGPVEAIEEDVVCVSDDCGWRMPIPWEQF